MKPAIEIVPGSDQHLTLLSVPMGWNFLVTANRLDMLAFGRAVWQAALAAQAIEASDDWVTVAKKCGAYITGENPGQAIAFGRVSLGKFADAALALTPRPIPQPPTVEAQPASEPLSDDFRGDNAQLILSAKALLDLDKKGALVPHGIGGHARGIISAFIARLPAPTVKGDKP